MNRQCLNFMLGICLICSSPLAAAADTRPAAKTAAPVTAGSIDSDSQYLQRISAQYTDLAGSEQNLHSLTEGLRTGSSITLTDNGAAGTAGSVTFTPSTRPMGYGNITRTLDFANRSLAESGITHPTAQQLQAALTGGTVTNAQGQVITLDGVLQLRSDGMGWGQVAHELGISPAASLQGQQAYADKVLSAPSRSSSAIVNGEGRPLAGNAAARTVNARQPAKSGIVSAAGSQGITHAGGKSQAVGASNKGIVTAGGASAGHGGITTGSGGYSGSAASVSVQSGAGAGHANGNAYGHSKSGN